jgi:phosphatidate cytidylyltransferase
MAFNIETFKRRALTAVLFATIMLIGLLLNHWSFFVLFSVIHFGCWVEYQKLVGFIDNNYRQINSIHKYGVMIAGWCMMLYFTNDAFVIFEGRLHAMGWWLGLIAVFLLPISELLLAKQLMLKNIGYSFLGLIYISLSWGLMMDLRCHAMTFKGSLLFFDGGYIVPCILIFSIWINDTMAYIVGSLIGKTPFSKISPKKTWEGTIGGAILCVSAIAILASLFDLLLVQHCIAIATIAAVVGTVGDLLESKLKRMAGVKDSGSLMPGHGGFLDRFDSLILATPFVWAYVKIFT